MKFDPRFLHATPVEGAAGEKICDGESKHARIRQRLLRYAVGLQLREEDDD